ncbi:biofilm protein TabA [Pontibacter chinhatensis]|uniref:Biofilm protein TabA n=2 Tax=Pontibacter chinhatensis TaxID=1436961 RepID=A0A1I2YYF2_9BACT|nr:biofilm protein TabA [Pontibacter chinhatensis]
MIYETADGVYLFGYTTLDDSHSKWDALHESIEDAKEEGEDVSGVGFEDWVEIPDPMEHCQHDWINPVRVKGRDTGTPDWGKYERFENGKWIELEPSKQ